MHTMSVSSRILVGHLRQIAAVTGILAQWGGISRAYNFDSPLASNRFQVSIRRMAAASGACAVLRVWSIRIGVCVRARNRSAERGDSEGRSRNPECGHKYDAGHTDQWRGYLQLSFAETRK